MLKNVRPTGFSQRDAFGGTRLVRSGRFPRRGACGRTAMSASDWIRTSDPHNVNVIL